MQTVEVTSRDLAEEFVESVKDISCVVGVSYRRAPGQIEIYAVTRKADSKEMRAIYDAQMAFLADHREHPFHMIHSTVMNTLPDDCEAVYRIDNSRNQMR